MSTFQLSKTGISEAQSEIKHIINTLTEIQNQIKAEQSGLNASFICSASSNLQYQLDMIRTNDCEKLSEDLSRLISTLDEIAEITAEAESKASSNISLNDILIAIAKEFEKNHAKSSDGSEIIEILSNIYGVGGNIAGLVGDIMEAFKDVGKFGGIIGDIGDALGKAGNIVGVIGSALSVFDTSFSDFNELIKDGNFSNRDVLKFTNDVLVNTGVEVVGVAVSEFVNWGVTAAITAASGGTLAVPAKIAGTVAGTACSFLYDSFIKEPVADFAKNTIHNTIDFIGENHIIENTLEFVDNTVETAGNIVNTAINAGGDFIQESISDTGYKLFGNSYEHIDNIIDNAQSIATNTVDFVKEGVSTVTTTLSGWASTIFSD